MDYKLTYLISFGIILLLSLGIGCDKEVVRHDIDAEIQQLMIDYGLPSVSACVIKGNEVVWSGYYGYADKENMVAASEETIYHIASISKLFIATAIMQLSDQGKLNIDDDINNYLPSPIRNPHWPEISITTRMLLTHTAGIAWPQTYEEALGIWDHFPPDEAPAPSEWIPQYLLPSGESYNPKIWKDTKPGTFELYTNIGSNVMAYLVEQITGQNFREYCKENIFLPLGMTNTSYNFADLDINKIAVLYTDYNTVEPIYDDRIYASGGLKTSIADLSRFLMVYLNSGELEGIRILEETSVHNMFELQNPITGRGLIWDIGIGAWYGHLGGMSGCATTAEIQPKEEVGLIIFTNKHKGVVYPGHEIHGLLRNKVRAFR